MANKSFIYDIIINVKGNINKQLEKFKTTELGKSFDKLGTKIGNSAKNNIPYYEELSAVFKAIPPQAKLIVAGIAAATAAVASFGLAVWKAYEANKALNKETRLLREQFKDLNTDQILEANAKIQTLATNFESTSTEIIGAAKSMTKNLGASFNEAIDLIENAFIRGGDAIRASDLLDTLKEYSVALKETDITAGQLTNLAILGAKEGFKADKAADTLKELNLRLNEQTLATKKALYNAFDKKWVDDYLIRIKNGVIGTSEAIVELQQKMTRTDLNKEQKATLAADVFGAVGEDVGGALSAINLHRRAIEGLIVDTKTFLEKADLAKPLEQDFKNFISNLQNFKEGEIASTLKPLGEAFGKNLAESYKNGAITELDFVKEVSERIEELRKSGKNIEDFDLKPLGLRNEQYEFFTKQLIKTKDALDEEQKELKALIALQAELKESQDRLTRSFKPLATIGKAIDNGLTKSMIWLYDVAKVATDAFFKFFKTLGETEGVKELSFQLSEVWQSLKDAVSSIWEMIKSFVEAQKRFTSFLNVTNAFNNVISTLSFLLSSLMNVIDSVVDTFKYLYDTIKSIMNLDFNGTVVNFTAVILKLGEAITKTLIVALQTFMTALITTLSHIPGIGDSLSKSLLAGQKGLENFGEKIENELDKQINKLKDKYSKTPAIEVNVKVKGTLEKNKYSLEDYRKAFEADTNKGLQARKNSAELVSMNAHRAKLAAINNGIAQDTINSKLQMLDVERSLEDTKLEDLQARKDKELSIVKESYKLQIQEANLAAEEMLRNAAGKSWGESFSKEERGAAMTDIRNKAAGGDAVAMQQLETINEAYARSAALRKQQEVEIAALKKKYEEEELERLKSLNNLNTSIKEIRLDQDEIVLKNRLVLTKSLQEELNVNKDLKKAETDRLDILKERLASSVVEGTDLEDVKTKEIAKINEKISKLDSEKRAYEELIKLKDKYEKSKTSGTDSVDVSELEKKLAKLRETIDVDSRIKEIENQKKDIDILKKIKGLGMEERELEKLVEKVSRSSSVRRKLEDVAKLPQASRGLAYRKLATEGIKDAKEWIDSSKKGVDEIAELEKKIAEAKKKAITPVDTTKLKSDFEKAVTDLKTKSGIDIDVSTISDKSISEIKAFSEDRVKTVKDEIEKLNNDVTALSSSTLEEIAANEALYGVELATKAKEALEKIKLEETTINQAAYNRDIASFRKYIQDRSDLIQKMIDRENYLYDEAENNQKGLREQREADLKKSMKESLKSFNLGEFATNFKQYLEQGFLTEKAIMEERIEHLEQVRDLSIQLANNTAQDNLIGGFTDSGLSLEIAQQNANQLINIAKESGFRREEIEAKIGRKISDNEMANLMQLQNATLNANKEFMAKKEEIFMTDSELRWDRTKRLLEQAAEVGQAYVDVIGQVFDVMNQYTQAQIDKLSADIETLSEKLSQINELISESENRLSEYEDKVDESRGKRKLDNIALYDKEREKLIGLRTEEAKLIEQKKQAEEEQKQLQKDSQERAEKLATLNQMIATTSMIAAAAESIKSAQSVPFPANLIAAATSLGALVSLFATAKSVFKFEEGGEIPKEGGVIKGNRHSKGGVPFTVKGSNRRFEAEGGEYIFSREAVNRIGLKRLNEMNFNRDTQSPNKLKFATGGLVGGSTTTPTIDVNSINERMDTLIQLQAMNNQKESVVSVSDINSVNSSERVRVKSSRF